MKKLVIGAIATAFATTASAQVAPLASRASVNITGEEIAAILTANEKRTVSDQSIRMVDIGTYNVGVGIVQRLPGVQGAIEHSKITEVYHMIEGAGVLVTGGTIPEAKPAAPQSQVVTVLNGPSNTGATVAGGTGRRVKAGDVVIIPPNTAHWWSSLEGKIVYLVVRVDPEKVVQIK